MKKIGAANFKEQCFSILDHLGSDGLIITKRGRPVAKLIPIERVSGELIGSLRARIQIRGDILSTGVT